jgi:hypothetical protein
LTVFPQRTKALEEESPEAAAAGSKMAGRNYSHSFLDTAQALLAFTVNSPHNQNFSDWKSAFVN